MVKKYTDVTRLTPDRRTEVKRLQQMREDDLFMLDTSVIDAAAFGFRGHEILEVPLKAVNIKYPGNLRQAEMEVPRRPDPKNWRKAFKEPIDITLRKGKLDLEDGHHRFVAAKRLGKETIMAKMDISDNPIKALRSIKVGSDRLEKMTIRVVERYLKIQH